MVSDYFYIINYMFLKIYILYTENYPGTTALQHEY